MCIANAARGEQAGAAPEETVAWQFTQALVTGHAVSDTLYDHAVMLFGSGGLVDMVHLAGIYSTTSALINAFAVPAPATVERTHDYR